jgi:glycosyltransferase involved in cell wall biosynthesis
MNSDVISLIVSTYNWPEALAKVFRALRQQSVLPGEIILADDGSAESTRHLIEAWQPKLGVPVRHLWQEDLGFRKTRVLNRALAVARGKYVVFLDGDCIPHPRFIEDHAALAEPGFWVQGRRCFVKEPWVSDFEIADVHPLSWLISHRISSGWKAFRFPAPIVRRNCEQRGILGCNMGFWREDLLAVNGFDEDYFGWGIGEDSDLGTRLYHLGRPRKFVYGRAIIFHLNHSALSRDHLPESLARLRAVQATGKIRCDRGVDQYLQAPTFAGSPGVPDRILT